MACSFSTSSGYGFPGTPDGYETSYPLSSATGGPLGPSAGPSKTCCCIDGQCVGPCQGAGSVCGPEGAGTCTSQCVAGTKLVFHNCYNNSLTLVSGSQSIGTVKPNSTTTVKAGTYVTGQSFLLASGKKPVSGTYHAPVPSSLKKLDIYFRSDGSVSMSSCKDGLSSWLLYGAIALVIIALLYFWWRR